ncbi:MAG: hypothetical protein ACLQER_12110 [Streptosporangiaceae bacterium]|jgi:hypothetical protein
MDPRFRPTLWPGTIISVPPLRPMDGVEVRGDWIVWPTQFGPRRIAQLPHDFYLRELMNLDPNDLDAAAEIMSKYGMLFEFDQPDLKPELRAEHLIGLDFEDEAYDGFHREDVCLHIEIAQYAIQTWIALQAPGGLEALMEPELNDITYTEFRRQYPGITSDRNDFESLMLNVRLHSLYDTLNAALTSISVGVVQDPFGEGRRVPGDFTVYSASFLQLYNHMVERATVKRCANEPCQQVFVRQRGRSRFDQNRLEGVKYCSRECSRAQAQRELRRRRKRLAAETR